MKEAACEAVGAVMHGGRKDGAVVGGRGMHCCCRGDGRGEYCW